MTATTEPTIDDAAMTRVRHLLFIALGAEPVDDKPTTAARKPTTTRKAPACARCGSPNAHRYGLGGHPWCPVCRSLPPLDPRKGPQ